MRQTDRHGCPFPLSGEYYYETSLFSLYVALRSHARPLTHTTSIDQTHHIVQVLEPYVLSIVSPFGVTKLNPSSDAAYVGVEMTEETVGNDHIIKITSTLRKINVLIYDLIWAPQKDFYGRTHVHLSLLSAADLDLYKQSFSRFGVDINIPLVKVPITVTPHPDQPHITVPASQIVGQAGQEILVLGVSIQDPDTLTIPPAFILAFAGEDSSSTSALSLTVSTNSGGKVLLPTLIELGHQEFTPATWRNDTSLHVQGGVQVINRMLKFLRFVGSADDTITLSVVSGGGICEATIPVRVIDDIQASTIALQIPDTLPQILEDENWALQGIFVYKPTSVNSVTQSLSVPDATKYEIVIACEYGLLHTNLEELNGPMVPTADRVQVLSSGPVLHLRTSSLVILNNAIANTRFTPNADYTGSVLLSLSAVADPAGASPGVSSAKIVLAILPVDDAPNVELRNPSMASTTTAAHAWAAARGIPSYVLGQEITTAAPLLLSSFEVSDVDDNNLLQIDVSCIVGAVSMSAAFVDPALALTVLDSQSAIKQGGVGSQHLVFFADVSNITQALDYLVYHPARYHKGSDAVNVTVTSLLVDEADRLNTQWKFSHGKSDSTELLLSVNMPPVVKVTCVDTADINEDESLALEDVCSMEVKSSVKTGDADSSTSTYVRLTLKASEGELSIGDVSQGTAVKYTLLPTANSSVLSIKLSQTDISGFLGLVSYNGGEDINGLITLTMTASLISLDSMKSQATHSKEVLLTIHAVNDPPVLTVPHQALTISQNESLPLTSLSVFDVDLLENELGWIDLKMSADSGSFRLASVSAENSKVLVLEDGGSGSMRLLATDSDLTALFASGRISYLPPAIIPSGENAAPYVANITIHASDNGFYGATAVPGNSSVLMQVEVVRVDVIPSLSVHKALVGTEDEVLSIGHGITLLTGTYLPSDFSTGVTLTVSSPSGALRVEGSSELEGLVYPSEAESPIVLKGSLLEMEKLIANLIFVPSDNISMQVSIFFELQCPGLQAADTQTMTLFLQPVNDVPTFSYTGLKLAAKQSGIVSLALLELVVSDVDLQEGPNIDSSGKITVTISTFCGALQVEPQHAVWVLETFAMQLSVSGQDAIYQQSEICLGATGAAISSTSADSMINSSAPIGYRSLVLEGDLGGVNAALLSIAYQAPSSYSVGTKIAVKVSDNGNFGAGGVQEADVSIGVDVEWAEAPPILRTSASEQTVSEGDVVFGNILLADMSDTDLLSHGIAQFKVIVSTTCRWDHSHAHELSDQCTVELIKEKFPELDLQIDAWVNPSITLSGTYSAVFKALQASRFNVPAHYHGIFSVSMQITDLSTSLRSSARVEVKVLPVNDAPIVIVNTTTSSSLLEDTPTALSALFTVSDPDTTFLQQSDSLLYNMSRTTCCGLQLAVSCDNCLFNSNNTVLVRSFQISGAQDDVNAVLDTITVQGAADFSGEMSVSVEANDRGNFGSGDQYTVSKNIAVTVLPVNDAPAIFVPKDVFDTADRNITLFTPAPSVIDVDSVPNEVFTVTLTCNHGNVTVDRENDPLLRVDMIGGEGAKQGKSVSFEATIDHVNNALRQLYYMAPVAFSGRDVLNITVVDSHGAASFGFIVVWAKYTRVPPTISFSGIGSSASNPLTVQEDGVLSLRNLEVDVKDPYQDTHAASTERLQGSVKIVHEGVLEIQTVTTASTHIDQMQTISFVPTLPNLAYHVNGGTFTLDFDLSTYGLGVVTTAAIRHDAIAMKAYEREDAAGSGTDVGESVQAKIEALPGLQSMGVTVSVSSQNNATGPVPDIWERAWQVTFHEADYRFPLATVNTNSVVSASGGTSSTTSSDVKWSAPSNELGGTFRLFVGETVTEQIAFDAGADTVATALESLSSVHAVAVERSVAGLDHGFAWTVTFFASQCSERGSVPLIIGDATSLTGTSTYNSHIQGADTDTESLSPPTVSAFQDQAGAGDVPVYIVQSKANVIEPIVNIRLITNMARKEEFFINVTEPNTNRTALIGPIYAETISMAANETLHAQPAGARANFEGQGESMQSLVRALPFFAELASDVSVSRVSLTSGPTTTVDWSITFHSPFDAFDKYEIEEVADGLSSTSTASVTLATDSNRIGGSFKLSYNGQMTESIAHDADAASVRTALLALPAVHESTLDLGDVLVARRGPGRQKNYSWYVSLLQVIEAETEGLDSVPTHASSATESGISVTTADVVDLATAGLTGVGASIMITKIRWGPRNYGVRLLAGAAGTSFVRVSDANNNNSRASSAGSLDQDESSLDLDAWQQELVFAGSPDAIRTGLQHLEYRATERWSGKVTLVIRVSDTVSNTASSAALYVDVQEVYNPPELYWRLEKVKSLGALGEGYDSSSTITVHEDADTRISIVTSDEWTAVSQSLDKLVSYTGSKTLTDIYFNVQRTGLQLVVNDAGSDVIYMTIAVKRGYVSLNRDAPLRGQYSQETLEVSRLVLNGSHVLSEGQVTQPVDSAMFDTEWDLTLISGNIFDINFALDSLKYQSPLNANGHDYLNISVWNANPQLNLNLNLNLNTSAKVVMTRILNVDILPLNDAPVISVAGTTVGLLYDNDSVWDVGLFQLQEDVPYAIGTQLSLVDPDLEDVSVLDDSIDDFIDGLSSVTSRYGVRNDYVYLSLDVEHGRLSAKTLGASVTFLTNFTYSDTEFSGPDSNWTAPYVPHDSVRNSLIKESFNSIYKERAQLAEESAPRAFDSSAETALFYNMTNQDIIAFVGSTPQLSSRLDYDPRYGGARRLCVRGHYKDIQDLLSSVVYTPDADWFGIDTITVYANDLGNMGEGGAKDTTRRALLNVSQIADGPTINLPSMDMMTTLEDITGVIGADCCNWAGDNFNLSDPEMITPNRLHMLNMSTLSFSISDRDVYTSVRQMRTLVRTNVDYKTPTTNDPLFNNTWTDPRHQDFHFYQYELNEHTQVDANFSVTLTVQHGSISMIRVKPQVQFLHGSGFQADNVTLYGPLTMINEALRGLNYRSDLNWNSLHGGETSALRGQPNVDILKITVTDAAGLSDHKEVSIYVKPTNDPPVLSFGGLTVHNSKARTFDEQSRSIHHIDTLDCIQNSNCPLLGLEVRDSDMMESPDGAIQVTLVATNGTLSIDPAFTNRGAAAQIYVENDVTTVLGRKWQKQNFLRLTISATAVYTALDHVIYRPFEDYYGPDAIVISADDLGNTGYGLLCMGLEEKGMPCRLTDSITVPVSVAGRPDRIEINVPGGVLTGREDTSMSLLGLSFVNHDDLVHNYNIDQRRWEIPRSTNASASEVLVAEPLREANVSSERPRFSQDETRGNKMFKLDVSSDHGDVMFRDLPQTLSTSFKYNDFVQDAWSHITATGHMRDLNVAGKSQVF